MNRPGDDIILSWCSKHTQWWVNNCPDCMADSLTEEYQEEYQDKINHLKTEIEDLKDQLNEATSQEVK